MAAPKSEIQRRITKKLGFRAWEQQNLNSAPQNL